MLPPVLVKSAVGHLGRLDHTVHAKGVPTGADISDLHVVQAHRALDGGLRVRLQL